jgi:hypothetical protein
LAALLEQIDELNRIEAEITGQPAEILLDARQNRTTANPRCAARRADGSGPTTMPIIADETIRAGRGRERVSLLDYRNLSYYRAAANSTHVSSPNG